MLVYFLSLLWLCAVSPASSHSIRIVSPDELTQNPFALKQRMLGLEVDISTPSILHEMNELRWCALVEYADRSRDSVTSCFLLSLTLAFFPLEFEDEVGSLVRVYDSDTESARSVSLLVTVFLEGYSHVLAQSSTLRVTVETSPRYVQPFACAQNWCAAFTPPAATAFGVGTAIRVGMRPQDVLQVVIPWLSSGDVQLFLSALCDPGLHLSVHGLTGSDFGFIAPAALPGLWFTSLQHDALVCVYGHVACSPFPKPVLGGTDDEEYRRCAVALNALSTAFASHPLCFNADAPPPACVHTLHWMRSLCLHLSSSCAAAASEPCVSLLSHRTAVNVDMLPVTLFLYQPPLPSSLFQPTTVVCRSLPSSPGASTSTCLFSNLYFYDGEWFFVQDLWNVQPHLQWDAVLRASAGWVDGSSPGPVPLRRQPFCSTSVLGDAPLRLTWTDGGGLARFGRPVVAVPTVSALLSRTSPRVMGHVIVDEYLPLVWALSDHGIPTHTPVQTVLMDPFGSRPGHLTTDMLAPLGGAAPLLSTWEALCGEGNVCAFSSLVAGVGGRRFLLQEPLPGPLLPAASRAFLDARARWAAHFNLNAVEDRMEEVVTIIARGAGHDRQWSPPCLALILSSLSSSPLRIVPRVLTLESLPFPQQVAALSSSRVILAVDGSSLELCALSLPPPPARTAVLTVVPRKGYAHLHLHSFLGMALPTRLHLAVEGLECVAEEGTVWGDEATAVCARIITHTLIAAVRHVISDAS